MMPVNLLVSVVFSLHCISNRTFASCSCIGDLLLSCACVWKLELSGSTGSKGFASNGQAEICHMPCHCQAAVRICSAHILHYPP